jgi:hypothetical protein
MEEKRHIPYLSIVIVACIALLLCAPPSLAGQVRVTVENLAPSNGVRITPVWVGFHDGSFDTFNTLSPASTALERLAEDGDPGSIIGSFTGANNGVVFGPITAPGQPPIYHPGETASALFNLDPSSNLYFSYLSMAIPSNDAFIGNDDPLAHFKTRPSTSSRPCSGTRGRRSMTRSP